MLPLLSGMNVHMANVRVEVENETATKLSDDHRPGHHR